MTVNQKRSDIFLRQLALLLLHGDSISNVVLGFTAITSLCGLKTVFDKRVFLKQKLKKYTFLLWVLDK